MSLIIICIIALIAGYIVKDDKGVSYLEKAYSQAHYYVVDRNKEALEKATDTKKMMQAHQDELQKMMNETK